MTAVTRESRLSALWGSLSHPRLSLSLTFLLTKKTLSKVPYLTVGILSYFDMLAANAFIGGRSRRDESTDTASPCAESRIM